ncbi:uncharacterized protein AB675_355 [Cyphellophora attinorum]|uniref:Thioesterase domain-containing protein n=1 Tax=Cyphellophora attinorum TaxID=1664694 RepID=A0A0N1HBD5_9EURO|nr:uncharacterized protein AB675_355 [Phialophora attinorum]KPI45477.1 hypothetical protein AB675_355 [Phialophora attinorum]
MADNHPDFDVSWIRELLSQPDTRPLTNPPGHPQSKPSPGVSNSLFSETLAANSPDAIRAQFMFTRPVPIADPTTSSSSATISSPTTQPVEQCMLVSLGRGVDGKLGRAHGGFSALLLDHVLGRTAAVESGATAPATATMTVDYKAPVDTPGVVLVRGWLEKLEGRKAWVCGTVEGEGAKVMATGRALFIAPKIGKI